MPWPVIIIRNFDYVTAYDNFSVPTESLKKKSCFV